MIVIAALLAAMPAIGQQEPLPVLADTAEAADRPSGRGAFLRSLVLPGWGQAYVGSPGRGSIYFAMEAGSLWMAYRSSTALSQARERDRFLREIGELDEGQDSPLVRSRERQVEDWLTISIVVLLFSGADAFVGAQLADFGEHIGVRPGEDGGAELRFDVPIGGVR